MCIDEKKSEGGMGFFNYQVNKTKYWERRSGISSYGRRGKKKVNKCQGWEKIPGVS